MLAATSFSPTHAAAVFELKFPNNSFAEVAGRNVVGGDAAVRSSGRSVIKFGGVTVYEPVRLVFHPSNRWLEMTSLKSPPPSDVSGGGVSLSRDGNTLVGNIDEVIQNQIFRPRHATRWTQTTGLVDLGSLFPAFDAQLRSYATDVSNDGSILVGYADTDTGGTMDHAFGWTQAGGIVDLGTGAGNFPQRLSRAYGVSGDGSVIVGESHFPGGFGVFTQAFRWTNSSGFQSLGAFDAGHSSVAHAVTADGSVVVGSSETSIPAGNNTVLRSRAFRWTQSGGLQNLGTLPGYEFSAATAVSDDGNIVVGICSTDFVIRSTGLGGLFYYVIGDSRAFLWTVANGMQDLAQLLAIAGLDMAARPLEAAVGLSPDGTWISALTSIQDPEAPTLRVAMSLLVSLTATLPVPSRLANLSTRGQVLTGENVLIPGFVIEGSASKRLLIRAVGPTLGGFGVSGTLADPVMTLKRTIGNVTTDIATNDNWSTSANAAEIATTTTTLGAFDLPAGSVDAALLVDLEPGQYSVVAQGVASSTGVAIVELYDGDSAPGGSRLANISTRGFVGTGESIMIPGYVVSADSSLRLLVRAVGPTLGTFGVSGALSDPQLVIRRDNGDGTTTEIASNNDWGTVANPAATAAAAAVAGAFELAANSKDAALVVHLLPGVYTVQASGVGGATGVALVEVYALE